MDHASLLKQFEHLDPHNQNTFEAKDLELLISTVGSCTSDPVLDPDLDLEHLTVSRPPKIWRTTMLSDMRSSNAMRC